MDSIERASRLIDAVRALGVDEFCVCAGSRNAPLLVVLGASDARLFSFVDERSAAFFALGRIKLHGQPVAVVTTSGTAVAELLPATVEAYYSGLPLVLITADRPARFRGTAAPQSIEQVGIFGIYAETSDWSRRRPLHLNLELEESWSAAVPPPLSDIAAQPHRAARAFTKPAALPPHSRPLILLGALAAHHREAVKQKLHAPVYAEPLSGLREDPDLPLIPFDRLIAKLDYDVVIRIGNVPTLRFWRDLETLDVPVLHFSDLPFPGVTRGEVHPIESLPHLHGASIDAGDYAERFAAILDDEPESELAMIRKLSHELPQNARVYLGNSLPIREWDLAATREPRGFVYEANRGANGIDGQLSTFLGWCAPDAHNIALVGDLTAIYDLGAPWIAPQLDAPFRIVIINNGGGRIFGRVGALRSVDPQLRARIIENEHSFSFEHFAKMWNIDVTELRPDAETSRRAWERYDALWV
ncbi:MAG TPA: thiamine pyrophosphate-binding protein [Thermoanaerobaculia bacterium]|jgi:2-succinyl-5-enolpyruvyl-6-hydroxy-3-cyclohexene-1-carboxylate synthase|nr:thiamine pyrophosphate-binding protein [Thermoanaerobaculia bacterium]